MATLIKCNHDILPKEDLIKVEPENKTNFNLNELYKLLLCDTIEVIYLNQNEIMIIDENGKLLGKPLNDTATHIYRKNIKNTRDYIVGHALVCNTKQLK